MEKGTTIEELLKTHGIEQPTPIVAAMVDNKLQELTHTLEEDSKVDFVDLSFKDGSGYMQRPNLSVYPGLS